jgi:hypothetical protein
VIDMGEDLPGVAWVGIAMRLSNGAIITYELLDNPHVTIHMSQTFSRADFMELMTRLQPTSTEISIQVTGRARDHWDAGAEDARRHGPMGALTESPRAIEGDVT